MASVHEFKAYPQHNRADSALKGYLIWVKVRPDYALPAEGRTLPDQRPCGASRPRCGLGRAGRNQGVP